MKLEGRLEFHSETGTEGGDWAFQDSAYCHTDADLVDGKCPWGMMFPVGRSGERACPAMPEYWTYGDYLPEKLEHWQYEGLHTLRNGDRLTVYSKDRSRVVWEGVVELEPVEHFTQRAWGLWIKKAPRQLGKTSRLEWAEMFLMGLPATLERQE